MNRNRKTPDRQRRPGWTMVELLAVVGVVGILLAILLPAVLAARELARRTECRNNLRQLGVALQTFENVREAFPPGAVTGSDLTEAHRWLRLAPGPAHNWATLVLPFLDQSELASAYDWTNDWRAVVNRPVRETPLG